MKDSFRYEARQLPLMPGKLFGGILAVSGFGGLVFVGTRPPEPKGVKDNVMKGLLNFCDLSCVYASMPKDTGVDGSGSCRTFVAVHCKLKKMLVHKNMPCSEKVLASSSKKKKR